MIKVECWSHGSNAWVHYHDFESVEEYEAHIADHGYGPRFFRIAD